MRAASASVVPLLAWLSPSYPVGAYAYSHGLEWAVEAGHVSDEPSLAQWLTDVLEHGAGRNDAILLVHAHRAVTAQDARALFEANELALGFAPSRELRLETSQQGRSFLDATLAAWPAPGLTPVAEALPGEVAYPIAVGACAGAHGVALPAAVEGYLLAFVQNLVSAAVRLAPIGQTGGTRVVAGLAPAIAALAASVPDLTLDDLGGCTFRADLGSFLHETQYTRLFRS